MASCAHSHHDQPTLVWGMSHQHVITSTLCTCQACFFETWIKHPPKCVSCHGGGEMRRAAACMGKLDEAWYGSCTESDSAPEYQGSEAISVWRAGCINHVRACRARVKWDKIPKRFLDNPIPTHRHFISL